MKILITGTAGFIGFHLALRLLKEGNEIVGLDNINDYYDVNLKYARLAKTGIDRKDIVYGKMTSGLLYSNYRFIQLDLEDRQALEELFAKEKFAKVCHLAAQAGVRYSIQNPHAYIQSNVVGFLNVLECCRHNHIQHLLYASSSSVYGMNAHIPFSESDRVDYPVSLYAATKKSNELKAHVYSHLYRLPTTGLRFFTVYGPYGRPDMAPMLFADAIMSGKPIKVYNNGEMMRDFTFIDDIVEGIVRLINYIPQQEQEHPFYNIFNIGNSQPVALMDFIRTMEDAIGKRAILEMYPMQPGDVKVTYADTNQLEIAVNYKPEVTINNGIRQFINWYKTMDDAK